MLLGLLVPCDTKFEPISYGDQCDLYFILVLCHSSELGQFQ